MTTTDTAELRCVFPGCVSTDRHWHFGFPGGYENPADPDGPPIEFTTEPEPGVRDYHGALLAELQRLAVPLDAVVVTRQAYEQLRTGLAAAPTPAADAMASHAFGICAVCGASVDDPEAREYCEARDEAEKARGGCYGPRPALASAPTPAEPLDVERLASAEQPGLRQLLHQWSRSLTLTDSAYERLQERTRAALAASPSESSTLDVTEIRSRLRSSYRNHPDSSHGEDYRNSGILSALRIVADLAGDLDLEAPCEAEGDPRKIGERNWCQKHIAPMGHRWHCDLAESPWVWRDARLAAEPSAEGER